MCYASPYGFVADVYAELCGFQLNVQFLNVMQLYCI